MQFLPLSKMNPPLPLNDEFQCSNQEAHMIIILVNQVTSKKRLRCKDLAKSLKIKNSTLNHHDSKCILTR